MVSPLLRQPWLAPSSTSQQVPGAACPSGPTGTGEDGGHHFREDYGAMAKLPNKRVSCWSSGPVFRMGNTHVMACVWGEDEESLHGQSSSGPMLKAT